MIRSIWLGLAAAAGLALAFLLFPSTYAEELTSGEVTVRLTDTRTGGIDVSVRVPARTSEVTLFATMPGMGHMTPAIIAERKTPGVFRATGELFSMTGEWVLTVEVDGEPVTFDITVDQGDR
ncbi:hypothetical protein GCM10022243_09450 [Saccharothrix violaceirubra]|uniref:YtkA-like domain-containing protein n=1 Tax=Saccharothrix violaceirubra TaxID=413306 RepID=A0A7W7T463_9PSEU|nr:FixH family protein [Saccharothrix violaceirubra]MBB4966217.1 hypothetical protein [Saccharothrix violaceirubra]